MFARAYFGAGRGLGKVVDVWVHSSNAGAVGCVQTLDLCLRVMEPEMVR